MVRILLFLASLALLALGLAWLADRPGEVAVTWLGYRIETSVMVAGFGLAVLVVVLTLLVALMRGLLRAPHKLSLFFRHRRAMKGFHAISRGLIAVGAGDIRLARSAADDAARLAPGHPLTLLLNAQSAQMAGDRAAAEHAFRIMAARDDTRLLGLHGLYVEAQRRRDAAAARDAAEQAAQAAPSLGWAVQAVLEQRCATGDWAGALAALEGMRGALDRAEYRRKRAILLTARAETLADTDRDQARRLVLEAAKLAPDLVPAAVMAGRRLAEAGETRKARRILENAWRAEPHPDIAAAYADLRLGDSARERLARMQKLAAMRPDHLEAALAVARAAVDAQEFATARAALTPYLAVPTRRVALLMAEIEQAEHGDEGRVREWLARAARASGDPVWTADGVVSERWRPVTPSGRLDGFVWKVPMAELGDGRPVIEAAPPSGIAGGAAVATAQPVSAAQTAAPPPTPVPDRGLPAAGTPSGDGVDLRGGAGSRRPVEPVMPLLHAPDDPGPDQEPDADPAAEPRSESRGPWRRIRHMFR
ncbi:MAG: heme biosynthesis protein HemY [Pseudolabrys sp.]|nr:heme biosynthesis protein HemY [Pseudolabrys sp.]